MRVARLSRQKVRVSRARVLESAMKVFSMYSSAKNVLEFEFFNEVGTGLGPTLEFYTLLAGEVQKKSLGMWRDYSMPEAGSRKGIVGALLFTFCLFSWLSGHNDCLGRSLALPHRIVIHKSHLYVHAYLLEPDATGWYEHTRAAAAGLRTWLAAKTEVKTPPAGTLIGSRRLCWGRLRFCL
jgi:hypothetical protein